MKAPTNKEINTELPSPTTEFFSHSVAYEEKPDRCFSAPISMKFRGSSSPEDLGRAGLNVRGYYISSKFCIIHRLPAEHGSARLLFNEWRRRGRSPFYWQLRLCLFNGGGQSTRRIALLRNLLQIEHRIYWREGPVLDHRAHARIPLVHWTNSMFPCPMTKLREWCPRTT